ncbi:hypothetical protein ZIOFF_041313 [Zingiber officinale]|uniref:Proteasome endopeptidase complex n=1 Tax=Zingiber officinale TaxID=94328 RepID=A0A8J5GH60_ZINOF|nr:hypothetical protein ZIOFF_041313 [Zingiber officinale]
MNLNVPHSMGTTIVGVTYDGGGGVLSADSKKTIGMGVTIDSAAISEVVSDYVRHILDQHTIQFGQPANVKAATNLARSFSYKNTNTIRMGQMGVIVGGLNKYEGSQKFVVAQGGTILKLPYAIDVAMDLNAPHSMGTTIVCVTDDSNVVVVHGTNSRKTIGMSVTIDSVSDKIT